ncbi:hypothetical protein D5S17_36160 [Pseudonocardiaceae bacterium YIM PH 21723]|nr:hypothetical protein D5S17_36160 [Pseudonocardiaceae bacterium YIM PH 21723]
MERLSDNDIMELYAGLIHLAAEDPYRCQETIQLALEPRSVVSETVIRRWQQVGLFSADGRMHQAMESLIGQHHEKLVQEIQTGILTRLFQLERRDPASYQQLEQHAAGPAQELDGQLRGTLRRAGLLDDSSQVPAVVRALINDQSSYRSPATPASVGRSSGLDQAVGQRVRGNTADAPASRHR